MKQNKGKLIKCVPFVGYAVFASNSVVPTPVEMKLVENVSIRQPSVFNVWQIPVISVVFVNL
jgi:hypothetical protein